MMWANLRFVFNSLIRKHPSTDLLQACIDHELTGLTNRFVRAHLLKCERCNTKAQEAASVLQTFEIPDAPADEVALLREMVITAVSPASILRTLASDKVTGILGNRGTPQITTSSMTPAVHRELTAFLGSRAARSLIAQIST
jgi:Putative zinc-finger